MHDPDRPLTVDVAVIGAGTAGMVAWRAAVRAGKRAVLIESGTYGTTCARVGCMPSKLLIAAADAAHAVRTSASFGIETPAPHVNGQRVMDRVRTERDRFVGFVLDDIEAMPAADRLKGRARFLSDTRLQVGDTIVEATATVIATGSVPTLPGDYSHLGDCLAINDDVFEWRDLPRRLLVVGAGVIGLELGQALARLGVQVTLINRSDRIGGLQDPEIRATVADIFQNELDVRFNTAIGQAERIGNEVHVALREAPSGPAQDRVDAAAQVAPLVVDAVLMAVGRRPDLAGLGLENTSAPLDEKGLPVMDSATLQLGSAPLFMAGDVTGQLPVLHEAADEGFIAGNNAARFPDVHAAQRRAPLSIVFTDPQLAQVGERYRNLDLDNTVIGKVSFANQGRARIMGKNLGRLHVYANRDDGRFLGAEMAGPAMEHIAHLLAWAHQQDLTVHDMLGMPFYHPVVEEGLRTALRDAARQLR